MIAQEKSGATEIAPTVNERSKTASLGHHAAQQNRPAATAWAEYGATLNVARMVDRLVAIDDELERLRKENAQLRRTEP